MYELKVGDVIDIHRINYEELVIPKTVTIVDIEDDFYVFSPSIRLNGDTATENCLCRNASPAMDSWVPHIEQSEKDNVNHPDHYTTGNTEVIVMLEDLASRYNDPVTAYLISTAGKYMYRAPYKGKQAEDLKKALWYLNRAVDRQSTIQ